jgi:transposase
MVFVENKGFDSDELLDPVESNDGLACIPPHSNRTSYRWCDREFYRKRHFGENIFQSIKYWRRVETRYAKLTSTFIAFATIACSINYIFRT